MLTLDTFAALTGADPHPGRPDAPLQGECPVCGRRRYLEALPFDDGTALVRCLAGCDTREILTALHVDETEVQIDDSLHGFEISHSRDLTEHDPFRSRLLDRRALARLPKPEPLIAETLNLATTSLLAGFHGTGKSFVALGWAAHVATGTPWMGREVTPGRVLYVVGEGASGIDDRLAAWEEENAVEIPPDRLQVFPDALQITNSKSDDLKNLLRVVEDGDYSLIVLDTLARCAVGMDENSADDMGRFVDALERIKKASGACVLTVHHTGKDKATVRGSSSLEAAMDAVYTTSGDPLLTILKRTKNKDGTTFDEHHLSLREVGNSVVFRALDDGEQPEQPELRDKVFQIIRSSFGDRLATRSELVRVLTLNDVPRATAYRKIRDLDAMGVLAYASGDNDKTTRYRVDFSEAKRAGLNLDPINVFVEEAPSLAEATSD